MSVVMGTMTTEGVTLAADTGVFQGYLRGPFHNSKMVLIDDACAVGVVGSHLPLNLLRQNTHRFREAFNRDKAFGLVCALRQELVKYGAGRVGEDGLWRLDCFGAVVAAEKEVYLVGPTFDCVPYGEKPVAVGCGGELALGAYCALRGRIDLARMSRHDDVLVEAVSVAAYASAGVEGMVELWHPNHGFIREPLVDWTLYDCARAPLVAVKDSDAPNT